MATPAEFLKLFSLYRELKPKRKWPVYFFSRRNLVPCIPRGTCNEAAVCEIHQAFCCLGFRASPQVDVSVHENELESRLDRRGVRFEWEHIKRDLVALEEVEAEF